MKHFLKNIFIITGAITLSSSLYNCACAADFNQNNLQEPALFEAAKAGDLRDQYRLGLEYLFNEKLNKQADAFFWIHSAADQGYDSAQFILAWMLAYGIGGVEKDSNSSRDWLELAAKNGNKNAQAVIKGEEFDKIIDNIKKSFKK